MTTAEEQTPGEAGGAAGAAGVPVLPRALTILLGGAAAVIVAAGLQALAWLVGPVFLALVIVIAVHPAQTALRRLGLPGWAATTALILLVYGVLLVLAGVVIVSVARLATILPQYAGRAGELLAVATTELAKLGAGPEQLAVVTSALNFSKLVGLAAGLLLGLTSLLGNLVFLLSLLLFLSLESSAAGARLAAIAQDREPVAAALSRFTSGTRRFLAVTTIFGLLTGAIDAVALAALGIPLAVLWGLLAFITNYIPYVGFFVGVVPPAILALLGGGWQLFLLVVTIYVVVNFILTSLVQPRFVGDAIGISVTVVLVALVFWGWLLGPLGAVLAIPLTLLAKLMLIDVDPRAGWADALLCATTSARLAPAPASPPPRVTPSHAVGPTITASAGDHVPAEGIPAKGPQ